MSQCFGVDRVGFVTILGTLYWFHIIFINEQNITHNRVNCQRHRSGKDELQNWAGDLEIK